MGVADLLEDDERFEQIKASYQPGAFGAALAVSLLVTALPTALAALFPNTFAGASRVAPLPVWALLVCQVGTGLWARRELLARRAPRFVVAYTAQSITQFLWLDALCWWMAPSIPLLAMGLLFGMMAGWAVNDAQTFHDGLLARALYGSSGPLFLLASLAVDAVGGPGLLHVARTDPSRAVSFATSLVLVTALAFTAVVVVGRIARERASERALAAEQRVALAASSIEQDALRQVAIVLESLRDIGPLANSFDLQFEALEVALSHSGRDAPTMEALLALRRAADAFVHFFQGAATNRQVTADTLLAEAGAVAERGAASLGYTAPVVTPQLQPSRLQVSELHIRALGNLMILCARHRAAPPLDIVGSIEGDSYLLRMVDRSLTQQDRAVVIDQLGASSDASPPRTPPLHLRGYLAGLNLARALFACAGGAFRVADDDDGLRMEVRIARAPDARPVDDPHDL